MKIKLTNIEKGTTCTISWKECEEIFGEQRFYEIMLGCDSKWVAEVN